MNDAMKILVVAAAFAILLLSGTSTYSAYVSSTSHRNSCTSRNLVLDTLHDVVQDAFAPAPGQTLTAAQVSQIQAVTTKLYARIDQARC